MIDFGWRVVFVEMGEHILFSQDSLCIEKGQEKYYVPINQIRMVVIDSIATKVSTAAIIALAKAKVQVVFCDEKHNPILQNVVFYEHSEYSGNLFNQVQWPQKRKKAWWTSIIKNKIFIQSQTAKNYNKEVSKILTILSNKVKYGNKTNIESYASLLYFKSVFGESFKRHNIDNNNSLLNYGYSIIFSLMNKIVTIYGYSLSFGIHHCNKNNPFNLTCDLMEPFRPIVDKYIKEHIEDNAPLNRDIKLLLVEIQYTNVSFDNKKYKLYEAMYEYVKDCIDYLNGKKAFIREIKLYE